MALHAQGEYVASDAGVVDQDLKLAEVGEDSFSAGFDGVFVRDIQREGLGSAALRGDFCGDLCQLL